MDVEDGVLLPGDVDVVIFHSPCSDGTASAYAAWLYGKNNNKNVEFIPTSHNRRAPDVEGKNVLICDFSYNKLTLLDMIKSANKLLVIDHHESAMKNLEDIPNKYKIFDMKHSGAYLTWVWFFGDVDVPKLILYVEDHDIWTKKLPLTNECWALMSTFNFHHTEDNTDEMIFSALDKYKNDDYLMEKIQSDGEAVWKYINLQINDACQYFSIKMCEIRERGKPKYYFILFRNQQYYVSEVANQLLTKNPIIDFVAVFNLSGETTRFSLRSDEKHVSVSTIAMSFGGGGHRNASGLTFNYLTTTFPRSFDVDYKELFYVYPGKLEKYTIVYLFARKNKTILSKYLAQERTPGRTNAQAALELVDKENNPLAFESAEKYFSCQPKDIPHVDLIATWEYRPIKDETKFVISFTSHNLDTIKFFNDSFKMDEKNVITLPGLHKFL